MRSIFNFILFPGIADQGRGFEKALSFSIDYLQVEIENIGSNGGAKKMKKLKNRCFHQFFKKISEFFPRIDHISNKN